jgi:hypothetical protein
VAVNVNVNFANSSDDLLPAFSFVENMFSEKVEVSMKHCYVLPDSSHHIPEDCLVDIFQSSWTLG